MQAITPDGQVIYLPPVTETQEASVQTVVGELIEGDEPLTAQDNAMPQGFDESAEPIVIDLTPAEAVEEHRDPLLDITSGNFPLLAKPIPGLAEKVTEALDEIGCKHDGIEIVSITETAKIAAMLTGDALRFITLDLVKLDPQNVMDRSINWIMGRTFDDMLDDRYGEALKKALGDEDRRTLAVALWSDIARGRISHERAEFGQIAERLLLITHSVVFHQAAFMKAKINEKADVVERISRLYAAGNPLIGLLRNSRFLVLTA